MTCIKLSHPTGILRGRIQIAGSKSESNRLLVLKELYAPRSTVSGLSNSSDTKVLLEAFKNYKQSESLNVGDAGTAMRFLTAFLAQADGTWILEGSSRMHQRPIGILVDALRQMGADIEYQNEEGYPPLRIKGQELKGGTLYIDPSVSSQYISALMMIAPKLSQGLELKFKGTPVSTPYIQLTGNLMRRMGFPVFMLGEEVRIPAHQLKHSPAKLEVEPDWSSASYWFAMAALAKKAELFLPGFKEYSLQGDSIIQQLLAPLGVEQMFIGAGIRIRKTAAFPHRPILNLVNTPDLAQTLLPAYAAKGYAMELKGLQTLKIKETDRIVALKVELRKFQVDLSVDDSSIKINGNFKEQRATIESYGDHRMAMGFAPLALLQPIEIKNPEVVEKSYPGFWEDCERLGFELEWL